ncbi:MAG: type II toxin-antitoxin system RelE/ParE family toxin [Gammaproteobacteria bacterium]
MTVEVRLRPEAEQDLADAAAWYEEQRPGLGQEFLDEALAAFSAIAEMPLMYAVVYRATRRALMHRFPFGIFYQLDDAGVVARSHLCGGEGTNK